MTESGECLHYYPIGKWLYPIIIRKLFKSFNTEHGFLIIFLCRIAKKFTRKALLLFINNR